MLLSRLKSLLPRLVPRVRLPFHLRHSFGGRHSLGGVNFAEGATANAPSFSFMFLITKTDSLFSPSRPNTTYHLLFPPTTCLYCRYLIPIFNINMSYYDNPQWAAPQQNNWEHQGATTPVRAGMVRLSYSLHSKTDK